MKKIIRLTESDIYNLVKRVINEQENIDNNYNIPNTGISFKIIDGQLYNVIFTKKGLPILKTALNGNLKDFKVNYKTKEIVDFEFNDNLDFTEENWDNIIDAKVQPMEYEGDNLYKFIAIVPNDGSTRYDIGKPKVYTARIVEEDIELLKSKGLKKSEDEIISPYTYYKKRGVGYYIQLYPGVALTTYNQPIDEPITPKKSFDLDISSPFVFDSTELTPPAKIELEKFIKSLKDKFKNINSNVQVTCSSSIDNDPEGKIGNQKRKDYDMELSKRRAETIVNTLKDNLPGFKLNFIPIGIGQTDQYAKGKKWPNFNQNETAPNRRLIIKLQTINDL